MLDSFIGSSKNSSGLFQLNVRLIILFLEAIGSLLLFIKALSETFKFTCLMLKLFLDIPDFNFFVTQRLLQLTFSSFLNTHVLLKTFDHCFVLTTLSLLVTHDLF